MSFIPKFYYLPRKKWIEDSDVLEPGENYWNFEDDSDEVRTSDGNKKGIKELSTEEQEKQRCFKKIVGILNKMTPDSFQTLMEEMKSENVDVKMLADIIFSKALVDEIYSEMYAKLCQEIMSELSIDHSYSFEQVLIYLCETGFENLLDFTDNDLKKVNEDKRYIFRRRLMTMMRFIGELTCIKKPIFSHKYAWKMAECLLEKGEDIHLEAVYFLLFTISIRSNVNTWPKSIEKEVKKIFKLHSCGILGSAKTYTELEEKKSNLCLPGGSCEPDSDIQCTEAKSKSLVVEEGRIRFPGFLHGVVVVILDKSGSIKPADSTLLNPLIEKMSKSVDCFKSQMHIYDLMPIISFTDRFSYDWFISHVNKQLTAEEKLICIDTDKYNETTFAVLKINCDFARGIELFAKTELELLKTISESNVDFPTSNWRIIKTSLECVLQSYCFTVTALVDLDSWTLLSLLKNSINLGSDCADVCTSKLPLCVKKEKEHDLKVLEDEVECCQKTKKVVKCKNALKTLDRSKNAIDKIDSTSNKNKLVDSQVNVNILNSVPENDSSLADEGRNEKARNKPKSKLTFNGARSFKIRKGPGQSNNCNKQINRNNRSLENEKKCFCNKYIKKYPNSANITACNDAENIVSEPSTSKAKSGTIKELMSCNTSIYSSVQNKVKFNRSNKWRRAKNNKYAKNSCSEHDIPLCCEQDMKKGATENQSKPKWKSNNPDIVNCIDQNKSETVFTTSIQKSFTTNQQNAAGVEITDVQRDRRFKDIKIQQDRQLCVQSKSTPITHDYKIKSAELRMKNTPQQQSQRPNPNPYLKYSGKPLVIGIFPNSSQCKDETIFETLNKCNSTLNIFEQMVLCRFDQNTSVQLTFTVDDLTFKELQKTEFRVRYKAYTILVKPLTSWAEAMTFSD